MSLPVSQTCKVLEFKKLGVDGVGNYLLAHGINPNDVSLLKRYEIDGDSLFDAIYDDLKQIGLKFNDFLKISKLMRGLVQGSDTVDTNDAAESKTFQSHVAVVIWNNHDGKEGVELQNLKEDVKNIKQTLTSLQFDTLTWGGDEKLEDFLIKFEALYRKCMNSREIGTVLVFYYGHGGRSKGQDGMIFNCGTHLPLSIVERKLNTLRRIRNIPSAIFFNACRKDLLSWDKNFQVLDAKYYITDSSHVNMTNVLVVYACLEGRYPIYSLQKGSVSEENVKAIFKQKRGLKFMAGSPFGLVVAQRLREDSLHTAIRSIIDDMDRLGRKVDVPNFKHLNDILPIRLRVPKDPRGKNLLQAVERGHVADAQALIPKLAHRLIDKSQDEQGNIFLHSACASGNPKMVQLLLDAKASINAQREDGKTPLLIACSRGLIQVVKRLVELKADVKAVDSQGHGPLHLACLHGHLNMIKYLVENYKIEIEAFTKQDKTGKKALNLAREVGQPDLVSYVERAIVDDKKMTKSRLCTFDKESVREWLWATQTKSRIESSVIQMLYDAEFDGHNLLSLARDPKMREVIPQLKSVQWMTIRRFLKPFLESDSVHTTSRVSFGRLKVFAREDVNLKDEKVLGRGAFGYALLVRVAGLNKPVVLKRDYYPTMSVKSLHAIDQTGSHPNILRIIGFVTLANDVCIITEYCAKGSLIDLARANKIEPSDKVLLGYAKPITHGLLHLHSTGIVHRDLRAVNILVHSNGRVVIADYGLSRTVPTTTMFNKDENDQPLPERWMAPECLRDNKHTYKGDIWSLGVVLYELLTRGGSPYHAEMKYRYWKHICARVINGSIRLIDESFGDRFEREGLSPPSRVIEIAKLCLEFDVKKRPDARMVLQLVEQAMSSV